MFDIQEWQIIWQMDRMDYTRNEKGEWIEGIPTREDAIFILTNVEN